MKNVYDEIRGVWVAALPEEIVRQKWLKRMVLSLGYPKEAIAVEKELRTLPHLAHYVGSLPERRIDIVCFGKAVGFPLLLLECKASGKVDEALQQALGYNAYVQAPYVGVAIGDAIALYGHGEEIGFLPTYNELVERLS